MTAILNFIDDNRPLSSGESFELFEKGFMKRVQDAAAEIPILKSFPIFNDLYPFAPQDSWAGSTSRNLMLGVLSETIIKIVGESCFQTNTPITGGSNASISTTEFDHFEGTGKRGFEPSKIVCTATGGIDLRDAIRVERIAPTANLAHNRSQASDPNRRDNEHDRRFTWVPADPLYPRDDALQYSVSCTCMFVAFLPRDTQLYHLNGRISLSLAKYSDWKTLRQCQHSRDSGVFCR